MKHKKNHKNIYLLGLISFFNDISSEMILPVLPLLIEQLGGGGVAVGLIGGMREGFAETFKFIFGYLSDKLRKRKFFIFWGYILTTIFKGMLALAQTWPLVFIAIALERVGKGVRSAARDTMLSTSSPDNIGRGFGIHRTFDTAGAIIGSMLAFIMLWSWGLTLKTIITIGALLTLFVFFPMFFLEEQNHFEEHEINTNFFHFSTSFKIFLVITSLFSLSNLSYMFFMLKAKAVFQGGIGVAFSMLLYVVFNISYTLTAVPMGIISDKFGRLKTLGFAYLLFACTNIGFTFAHRFQTLALLFACYGIVRAILKVSHNAYVADVSTPQQRATALGTFDTITGIMTLIGGGIIGYLWQHVGSDVAFYYAGAIPFACVLLMLVFYKKLNTA